MRSFKSSFGRLKTTGWLKTGNKQEAFISAQKLLKNKFKDPYYWGVFVMMN
ncbi:hypothetical protein [Reichenbachiella sp. MALMAid0571]|uniref:hypothetical protein n=1 Tax=Reichenbachiella sp. MALMAid0571 TaxID=3143939 RepID=UPI0032DE3CA4